MAKSSNPYVRIEPELKERAEAILSALGIPVSIAITINLFIQGIEFDKDNPYAVPYQGNREVKYADKKEIQDGILEKYPPERKEETPAPSDADSGGQRLITAVLFYISNHIE